LVAIGGAAVVNRLIHFCLEKRGARHNPLSLIGVFDTMVSLV
jgi:hypothetical protein